MVSIRETPSNLREKQSNSVPFLSCVKWGDFETPTYIVENKEIIK